MRYVSHTRVGERVLLTYLVRRWWWPWSWVERRAYAPELRYKFVRGKGSEYTAFCDQDTGVTHSESETIRMISMIEAADARVDVERAAEGRKILEDILK